VYAQCRALVLQRPRVIARCACGRGRGGQPAASCRATSTTCPPSSLSLPAGSPSPLPMLALLGEALLVGPRQRRCCSLSPQRGGCRVCSSQLEKGGLASGGNDGVINVWDLDSVDPVMTLVGHEKPVVALAAAPNGLLVSGSWCVDSQPCSHPQRACLIHWLTVAYVRRGAGTSRLVCGEEQSACTSCADTPRLYGPSLPCPRPTFSLVRDASFSSLAEGDSL
jgi:hypothetical protein